MTNAIEIDDTNATLQCRSQMQAIISFLKEYVPGYENCWLMSSGSLLGVRETRHFEGMEPLQPEDILVAREFDNWVVKKAWFAFDVHNLTGASLDKTGCQKHFTQQKEYTIPYGCLLPKGVDGLLLSGRNISGSHLAHSSFRVMPICIAIGEAAGVAAAISVLDNCKLQSIKAQKIQEML